MITVDTTLVHVDDEDDIVEISLHRPDKLNALTPEMVTGLHEAFTQLESERGRGVLLSGEGRATCAGMDRDIVGGGDYVDAYPDLNETLSELYDLVETHPGPVAIAGRGALIGASAILSLACEFVVLGPETTFAFPEVTYGIPSSRAARQVPDVVGRHVAAELLLTGDGIEPERAVDLGLVNAVVPADEVESSARALLESVGENDPETVASLVERINER